VNAHARTVKCWTVTLPRLRPPAVRKGCEPVKKSMVPNQPPLRTLPRLCRPPCGKIAKL
jgi:hypothetical protein